MGCRVIFLFLNCAAERPSILHMHGSPVAEDGFTSVFVDVIWQTHAVRIPSVIRSRSEISFKEFSDFQRNSTSIYKIYNLLRFFGGLCRTHCHVRRPLRLNSGKSNILKNSIPQKSMVSDVFTAIHRVLYSGFKFEGEKVSERCERTALTLRLGTKTLKRFLQLQVLWGFFSYNEVIHLLCQELKDW